MSFALSATLVNCQMLEEETLTSSQLSLSCTFQAFFIEATSCSALFSLAIGQGFAGVVQSQGYRILSPIFNPKAARALSTAGSWITEGVCFNTAAELGRSGQLRLGPLTDNVHGAITIAVCKAMGRGFLGHNAVVRNIAQNSALMSVDIVFEKYGGMEKKNFTLIERYFNCHLTSLRMEVSATFLGAVCPEVAMLKARCELDYQIQKPGKISYKQDRWNLKLMGQGQNLFALEFSGNNQQKMSDFYFLDKKDTFSLQIRGVGILMMSNDSPKGQQPPSSHKPLPDKVRNDLRNRVSTLGDNPRLPQQSAKPLPTQLAKDLRNAVSTLPDGMIKTDRPAKDLPSDVSKTLRERIGRPMGMQKSIELPKALPAGFAERFRLRISEIATETSRDPISTMSADRNKKIKKQKNLKKTLNDFQSFEMQNPVLAMQIKKAFQLWHQKKDKPLEVHLERKIEEELTETEKFEIITRKALRAEGISLDYFYDQFLVEAMKYLVIYQEIITEVSEVKAAQKKEDGILIRDAEVLTTTHPPRKIAAEQPPSNILELPQYTQVAPQRKKIITSEILKKEREEAASLHLKIREFIAKRKYKSGAVAEALELSRGGAYYGMLNGTHKPSVKVLLRLFSMDPETTIIEKLSIYGALYPRFNTLMIADQNGIIFVRGGKEVIQQTTFGKYIRRLREEKKLTTQKMAEALHITRSPYESLENDKMGEIAYEYIGVLEDRLEADATLLSLMSHKELFEIAEVRYI